MRLDGFIPAGEWVGWSARAFRSGSTCSPRTEGDRRLGVADEDFAGSCEDEGAGFGVWVEALHGVLDVGEAAELVADGVVVGGGEADHGVEAGHVAALEGEVDAEVVEGAPVVVGEVAAADAEVGVVCPGGEVGGWGGDKVVDVGGGLGGGHVGECSGAEGGRRACDAPGGNGMPRDVVAWQVRCPGWGCCIYSSASAEVAQW